MNILVIGSGAREHALCWKMSQSPLVKKIYCLPGNAGTSLIAENISGKANDIENIVEVAKSKFIDLVVVGPEEPLSLGIVDILNQNNILAFGPTLSGAQLESSKSFAKSIMSKGNIPTAKYEVFNSSIEAKKYINKNNGPYVIKVDGLASGKGVFISNTKEEAYDSITKIMEDNLFGEAGSSIVIEEFLSGYEISYHVICDGENYKPLVPARDYKKLYDDDLGPNTGGMGAYSSNCIISPELDNKIISTIVEPTLEALKKESIVFKGVLFIGLMICNGNPYVLEYNTRFGDPETEVILLRYENDIVPLLLGAAKGNIKGIEISWDPNPAVCVVIVSKSYPNKNKTEDVIDGLENKYESIEIFQANTNKKDSKIVTTGGRVAVLSSKDISIEKARNNIYNTINSITYKECYYRSDIAKI